jgi:hypothetical protein
VAQVAGTGMELYAFCQPPEAKKGAYSLALRLRENPRGVYPEFDARLQQGIEGSPAAGPDFREIALRFDDGSVFGVTGRVFGMTGELEITENGKPFSPTGKILQAMMSGRTMNVLADPFSGTFQLTNSRPAICSVLTACGVKISACKGISAPKISSKQITTQPKLIVLPQTAKGAVPPPPGFVPGPQGYVPAQQGYATSKQSYVPPKPFMPLSAKGGAALVIQQTASGPCPDPNQVRNSAGQCVCTLTYASVGGKCVKACLGGVRDQNGNCQCPQGLTHSSQVLVTSAWTRPARKPPRATSVPTGGFAMRQEPASDFATANVSGTAASASQQRKQRTTIAVTLELRKRPPPTANARRRLAAG